jgi:hypothetical protein
MKSENQPGADRADGSNVSPPDWRGVRYDLKERNANRFLSESKRFEGEIMPVPKAALDVRTVEPKEGTVDEEEGKSVNMTSLDEPQSHPEVAIIARALEIIGSPQQLGKWMNTSLPALQGQTPYSLMSSEGGRKQVEIVLGRIEHGIY